MSYRMAGLGATKATKAETAEARRAKQAARDEWKQYLASLQNLDKQLRSGALPPDQPLPSAPSNPSEMAPDLARKAKNILEKNLPGAYKVAETLRRAESVRVAASAYAAGQPPVSPDGYLVDSYVPPGALPGEVQQVVTEAYGATPILQQTGDPSAFQGPSVQPRDGAASPWPFLGGGSSTTKKVILGVAVAGGLYLAYRWWKGRGRR